MIKRKASKKLDLLAKEYGVVSVTGPRQSGKTTLVRQHFPNHQYFNLEFLSDLEKIRADPVSFINGISGSVIIDEVQKFPELLSYIQVAIDEHFQPARFVITGSQNLLLSDKVNQSLAGRVGILKLLPLSIDELAVSNNIPKNYQDLILKGFYPSIYDKKQTAGIYYNNYLNTYVERDVRNIKNIGDLSAFTKFLQLLAGRVGQILNLSEIGGVVGANHKTIDSWLSILEASYLVFKLEPYFNNFGKRLIKSPKIYFTDVGLAAHLLRLDTESEINNYHGLGSLFENMVIADAKKKIFNTLSSNKLYYFRDNKGLEIDLILDSGNEVIPIEVKSSATFNSDYLDNIHKFKKISGLNMGCLIYSGKGGDMISGVKVLNYKDDFDINLLRNK